MVLTIAKRLVTVIPTLIGVIIVTFLLTRVDPFVSLRQFRAKK